MDQLRSSVRLQKFDILLTEDLHAITSAWFFVVDNNKFRSTEKYSKYSYKTRNNDIAKWLWDEIALSSSGRMKEIWNKNAPKKSFNK